MGRAKTIFSGISWTIIQNVVNVLYGIVSVPFLLHYFGKEQYGLIGLALSVNVYIHLLDMGMTNSNVRFFSEFIAKGDKHKEQSLFSLSHLFYLGFGVLNSLILFAVSFLVNVLFKVSAEQAITLRNLLWILALNATFSWVSVAFDQYLQSKELIAWIKKRTTLLKIIQFGILAATILFKFTIEVYFFFYIFFTTVILPLSIIKIKKVSPDIRVSLKFDKEVFRLVIPYALSIFSFSIFQFLALNARPLFLGNMSGPASVADYQIMSTITSVVTVISTSFMQVLLPIMTKLTVSGDKDSVYKVVYSGTKYANILLSFVIFMLIVCLNELLILYVGQEYTVLTKWLSLWLLTLLLAHRNVMTSLVFTEKKIASVSVMGALAMVVAFIVYALCIPYFGVGGVVLGFLAHELVHTLFYYLLFFPQRLHFNAIGVFSKSVLPTWAIFGVLSLLIRCINLDFLSVWIRLFLEGSIMLILVFLSTRFLLLSKGDIVFLHGLITRKTN